MTFEELRKDKLKMFPRDKVLVPILPEGFNTTRILQNPDRVLRPKTPDLKKTIMKSLQLLERVRAEKTVRIVPKSDDYLPSPSRSNYYLKKTVSFRNDSKRISNEKGNVSPETLTETSPLMKVSTQSLLVLARSASSPKLRLKKTSSTLIDISPIKTSKLENSSLTQIVSKKLDKAQASTESLPLLGRRSESCPKISTLNRISSLSGINSQISIRKGLLERSNTINFDIQEEHEAYQDMKKSGLNRLEGVQEDLARIRSPAKEKKLKVLQLNNKNPLFDVRYWYTATFAGFAFYRKKIQKTAPVL